MKRIALFFVLTAIILSAAGCGKSEPSVTLPQPAETTETIPDETEPKYVADSLPEKMDFNGRKATWYVGDYMSAYWTDFVAEEEKGERVNDSVFSAQRNVEERLNVTLDYYRKIVQYNDRNNVNAEISASVLANDKAYDIYGGRNLISLMLEDAYLLDLSDVPHLDFEKPWWNRSQLNMMPGNKVFVASGDGSLSIIKHTFCILFNQDQLNDFGVKDDLYLLMENGKWTLDKLAEIAALGYKDVNGNALADYGDCFGLTLGDSNKILGFQFTCGGSVVEKSKSGYEIQYGSERMEAIFEKTLKLLNETSGVLMPLGNSESNTLSVASFGGNYADKTFMEGNALMTASLVGDAAVILGEAKFSYGLLPYPKFDENQENYISCCQRNAFFSLLAYADKELSGAILEAWSSEAYRSIQPTYFETTLKARYSSDSKMATVFDLLRETLRFEIGDYFTESLGSPTSPFRNYITNNNAGQWMSYYASKEETWQKTLNEIWEKLS